MTVKDIISKISFDEVFEEYKKHYTFGCDDKKYFLMSADSLQKKRGFF